MNITIKHKWFENDDLHILDENDKHYIFTKLEIIDIKKPASVIENINDNFIMTVNFKTFINNDGKEL